MRSWRVWSYLKHHLSMTPRRGWARRPRRQQAPCSRHELDIYVHLGRRRREPGFKPLEAMNEAWRHFKRTAGCAKAVVVAAHLLAIALLILYVRASPRKVERRFEAKETMPAGTDLHWCHTTVDVHMACRNVSCKASDGTFLEHDAVFFDALVHPDNVLKLAAEACSCSYTHSLHILVDSDRITSYAVRTDGNTRPAHGEKLGSLHFVEGKSNGDCMGAVPPTMIDMLRDSAWTILATVATAAMTCVYGFGFKAVADHFPAEQHAE